MLVHRDKSYRHGLSIGLMYVDIKNKGVPVIGERLVLIVAFKNGSPDGNRTHI